MTMSRTLLVLLFSLAVVTKNAVAADPDEAKVTASALAGYSWVWVYVERESDVLVLTLPLAINEGKASGALKVAETKAEVAVLVTGPEAKRHAFPKPPLDYDPHSTVPADGQHKIVAATAGEIKYIFVPDRSLGCHGVVTCDVTDLEIPDMKPLERLRFTAEVRSIPP